MNASFTTPVGPLRGLAMITDLAFKVGIVWLVDFFAEDESHHYNATAQAEVPVPQKQVKKVAVHVQDRDDFCEV